ncbi:MAG: hypothetical protein ACMVY4_11775 [Minwuia sp.]|uniref:hypothetical protein n=1 Tax=Minwuia sp. TaxID=2493630 RepID=UPI003A8BDEB7
MIHSIDCMTRLEPPDAMSRIRDAIARQQGRIADHKLSDGTVGLFNFALPDSRFEDFLDGLPELAVWVERAVSPERVRGREIRCRLAVAFPDLAE